MSSRGLRRRLFALAIAAIGGVVPVMAPTPASAAETGVGTTVVSGFHHSCVLQADSSVACWGRNQARQVGPNGLVTGDAATQFQATPVSVPSLPNVSSVSAGDEHSCALKTDGTVWCWGSNFYGQLGISTATVNIDTPTPTQVPGVTNTISLTTGSFHTCAVKSDGSVRCWGQHDVAKQVGSTTATKFRTFTPTCDTTVDPACVPPAPYDVYYVDVPTVIPQITTALTVDAGAFFTCALLAAGTVQCWGANAVGELGNAGTPPGNPTVSAIPVDVTGIDRVAGITAGFAHACARTTGGLVYCWGANDFGQSGHGGGPTNAAQQVLNLAGVSSVVAGYYHTCALTAVGGALCWGKNDEGQLGNGSTTNTSTPTAVSGVSNASAIAPGAGHTCVVRSNQAVACWGDNMFGAVADGNAPTDSATPKDVPGLTAIATAPVVTPPRAAVEVPAAVVSPPTRWSPTSRTRPSPSRSGWPTPAAVRRRSTASSPGPACALPTRSSS